MSEEDVVILTDEGGNEVRFLHTDVRLRDL